MERKSGYGEKLIYLAVSVLGVLLRYALRNDISGDYRAFLAPWYDTIQKLGIGALGVQVGDYNLPYQSWILLMTLFPVKALYAYKLVSCLFDYLLAAVVGRVVRGLTGSERAALAGYCAVILFPQVWIDSAHWAQCDSIYAFWVLLAVYLYLQEKYSGALFVLGIALSFKMQAIFILPFALIAWLLWGRHCFWKFLWLVPGFYLFCIPSLVGGRNLLDPLAIYLNQTTEYSAIRFNFPSFWGMLFPAGGHSEYNLLAILVTLLVLISGVCRMACDIQIMRKNTEGVQKSLCQEKKAVEHKEEDRIGKEWCLRLCIWSVWTCVLFLPNMHERYAYVLDILMLILFFVTKRSREIPLIAVCWMSSLVCYGTARLELPLSNDLFRIICACYAIAYFLYSGTFFEKTRFAASGGVARQATIRRPD